MSFEFTLQRIESLRDIRYHRTSELRATTEERALAFVDEVGFCFLFGDAGAEIPTLWGAVAGSRRPVPSNHFDADVGRAWNWKDSLPTRGAVYYGKLLRGKPTLVALALLPTFYALTPNYGDVEDYVLQYEEGRLGAEAKNVYEALLNEGALATSRLRQVAGLPGGGENSRRFERALTELQAEMKIVKVGISDANRWGYAYVYDLFLRRFPNVPEAARRISEEEAMTTLLARYLRNVIAVPEAVARRLFRWEPWEWDRVVERAATRGLILRGVRVEGLKGRCLATTAA